MKRPAQPEEIAPAYVYFASDVDSSYVTGEVLPLPGGETNGGLDSKGESSTFDSQRQPRD